MNRDVLTILGLCLLAIVAGIVLPRLTHIPAGVSFAVIEKNDQSGSIDERKNYRIHSVEELQALWTLVYGNTRSSLPTVDFSKNEVLAIFDGTHSSGGYGVSVQTVHEVQGNRVVAIERTVPGVSCSVTENITSPFVMIQLPKSSLPISREETERTVECP